MVELKAIIVPLTGALGLSVIVERVIEFITNVFGNFPIDEKVPVQVDKAAKQQQEAELNKIAQSGMQRAEVEAEAERIAAELEKTNLDENDPSVQALKQKLTDLQRDLEWNEAVPPNIIAWQPATPPNGDRVYREIAIHAIGLALGIFLAAYSKLELFNAFFKYAQVQTIQPWLDYIFTGVLISAGSGPVHVLIRFVSERKFSAKPEALVVSEQKKEKEAAVNKTLAGAESPALDKVFKDADWIPIAYEGGLDRDKLETVHLRRNDPDSVILHHTAMRRDSTFEDVVRVIKSRKDSNGNNWLTGYNCVITEDGGIHPFCRWDRYGSHAAGYNSRSLGLAFNGNFETSPSDPYSNSEGRYGPATPSRGQLESGARVVALWAHIYPDINPTFGTGGSIFPHRQVSAKNCPGSEFPVEEFNALVEYFYSKWEKSPLAMAEIKKFMKKPYLYKQ